MNSPVARLRIDQRVTREHYKKVTRYLRSGGYGNDLTGEMVEYRKPDLPERLAQYLC